MPTELSNISHIFRQIKDLKSGDEIDELGNLRPTDYAILKTQDLLMAVAYRPAFTNFWDEESVFPRGAVATDETGGLRIEWHEGGVVVRLVITSTEDGISYIYHEQGDHYGTSNESASVLAHWLIKLQSASQGNNNDNQDS